MYKKKIAGEVTEVRSSYDRIYVEQEDGDDQSYTITRDFNLLIPGESTPKVENVSIGQGAIVTYWGNDPESIEIRPTFFGEIISIDPLVKRITFKPYNGERITLDISPTFILYKDNNIFSSLSNLAASDRVKLLVDAKDKVYQAYLYGKVSGQVTGINRSTHEIYLNSISKAYHILDSAYIHDGSQDKTFDDIDHLQNINLYFNDDDKVVEVSMNE